MEETAPKELPYLPEPNLKQRATAILSQSGLTTTDISKVFGISTGRVSQIKAKVLPLSLVSPSTIKSAHKVVKRLMKGEAFGDIKSIKDSTVLAAAQTVLDRAEPKTTHVVNENIMASFTKIDLTVVGGVQDRPQETIEVEVIPKVKNKVKNYKRCVCGGMKGHRGPHREGKHRTKGG